MSESIAEESKPTREQLDRLFDSSSSSDEDDDDDNDDKPVTKSAKKKDTSTAYDKEEADVVTEEDKQFIVDDDGNKGIVAEYAKQNQDFNDERDDHFDDATDASGGTTRGREQKLDRQSALGILTAIVHEMHNAADKDDEALQNKEPAFTKLQQCQSLLERLRNFGLRDFLLDHEAKLLDAFARWLQPGPDGLCALGVRTASYDFIEELDIEMERDLKHTDLGKVLMALRKSKHETDVNKRKITDMIRKWTLALQAQFAGRKNEALRRKRRLELRSAAGPIQSNPNDADGDILAAGFKKARALPKKVGYRDITAVEMGTDRIRRKQARLSKRAVQPEKRSSVSVQAQLRKVCIV